MGPSIEDGYRYAKKCLSNILKNMLQKLTLFFHYQDAHDTVLVDLELARRENFYFGAKLVRGAYMEQERARAAAANYEDPIHPTYEATHNCYNQVADSILRCVAEQGAQLMIASHNEESIRLTVQKYV